MYAMRDALRRSSLRVMDWFRRADGDGSGTVDRLEFREVILQSMGIDDRPLVDSLFDIIDADGNGFLDFDEIHKHLRMGHGMERHLGTAHRPGKLSQLQSKSRHALRGSLEEQFLLHSKRDPLQEQRSKEREQQEVKQRSAATAGTAHSLRPPLKSSLARAARASTESMGGRSSCGGSSSDVAGITAGSSPMQVARPSPRYAAGGQPAFQPAFPPPPAGQPPSAYVTAYEDLAEEIPMLDFLDVEGEKRRAAERVTRSRRSVRVRSPSSPIVPYEPPAPRAPESPVARSPKRRGVGPMSLTMSSPRVARGLRERAAASFDGSFEASGLDDRGLLTPSWGGASPRYEANHLRLSTALPELSLSPPSLSPLALSPRNSPSFRPVSNLQAQRGFGRGPFAPPSSGGGRDPARDFVVHNYVRGMYRSNDIHDAKIQHAREELARAANDGELTPRREPFYRTRAVGRTKWQDPLPEMTVDGAPTWVVNVHSTVSQLEIPLAGGTAAALERKRWRARQRAREEEQQARALP